MGGSAGFKISMTLDSLVFENRFAPLSVASIYSSIFARVAGPALKEAILETISM